MSRHSSNLVQGIITDQREALRVALVEGLAAGRNPRSTALDIVGRINRATGRREGGIIGLTQGQSGYVRNAFAELTDPARLRAYLGRERRDRRFDPMVYRALDKGEALSAADATRVTARYSDRLLAYRGEVIARTETLTSLAAGRDEGMRQLVETGAVRAEQVTKMWRATGDQRTRDTHADMDGQEVTLDGLFVSPSGARMAYPGDTENGAPPEETIQCRCYSEVRVDFLAGVR